jgi:hypothetical protein
MVFKSHTDLTDLTDLLRCKQRGFSFGLNGKTPKESKIREIREIRVGKFNIIKKMDLRSYTKQELALLYFPDSDPDVARAHLMRWIVRCTQLYEQLLKSGYNKSCKEFNPLQVSYIFFHLGEP